MIRKPFPGLDTGRNGQCKELSVQSKWEQTSNVSYTDVCVVLEKRRTLYGGEEGMDRLSMRKFWVKSLSGRTRVGRGVTSSVAYLTSKINSRHNLTSQKERQDECEGSWYGMCMGLTCTSFDLRTREGNRSESDVVYDRSRQIPLM